MNKKIQIITMQAVAVAIVFAAGVAPVFAVETSLGIDVSGSGKVSGGNVNLSATATATATGEMHDGSLLKGGLREKAKGRADEEIDRRLGALTKLSDLVKAMPKLSDDEKSGISVALQAQLSAMATLKQKVDDDAENGATSTLREDIKSITASHRIFALIMPQGAIEAASDRIGTIATAMTNLGLTLQTQITAAQTAGKDVSVATTAMADFNAKVADAKVQGAAAMTEVSSLTPDNGDQAKFQANLAALKDARAKIKAAQKDLEAARDDARNVVKALRSVGFGISASSTTSASGTAGHE